MNDRAFDRWFLQTSTSLEDMMSIIKPIGIIPIDQDHARLAEYTLQLTKIIKTFSEENFSMGALDEAVEVFETFLRYTKYHFKREEEIIQKYHIRGLETQKHDHKIFIKRLNQVAKSFREGKVMATQSLNMELQDWIVKHINETDKSVFASENFSESLSRAKSWEDVEILIATTGLNFVDDEHKEVTILILEFIESYLQSGPSEVSNEKYDRFYKKIVTHFQHEQYFIAGNAIEDIHNQGSLHGGFLKRLEYYKSHLFSKRDESINSFKKEILAWWIEHTNKVDVDTFDLSNWAAPLFDRATNTSDISWIIKKTGIKSVDEQHLAAIEKAMEIFKCAENDPSNTLLIAKRYAELIHIVEAHFKHEESILLSNPDVPSDFHIDQHRQILEDIRQFEENLASGRIQFDNTIKLRIIQWWVHHTNYVDYDTLHRIPQAKESEQ
jgi:hemerythrin-like metal-binding protein